MSSFLVPFHALPGSMSPAHSSIGPADHVPPLRFAQDVEVLSKRSMYQTTGNSGSLMASCFHAQGRWCCAASLSRCGEPQWLRRVTRHRPWLDAGDLPSHLDRWLVKRNKLRHRDEMLSTASIAVFRPPVRHRDPRGAPGSGPRFVRGSRWQALFLIQLTAYEVPDLM